MEKTLSKHFWVDCGCLLIVIEVQKGAQRDQHQATLSVAVSVVNGILDHDQINSFWGFFFC